jgi:hypothetical protein
MVEISLQISNLYPLKTEQRRRKEQAILIAITTFLARNGYESKAAQHTVSLEVALS